jgi:hypothetical protein
VANGEDEKYLRRGLRRFYGFVDPGRADPLAVSSGAPFIAGVVPVTLSRP